MEEADLLYGTDDVGLDRIMDAAHCLPAEARHHLNHLLDAFERRFPQLFLSVYVDTLPAATRRAEFGFWLLNRAAIRGIGATRPNDNGILLFIDLTSREASIVTGYLAERLLPARTLRKALRRSKADLMEGAYGEGIAKCIDTLDQALRKIAIKLSRRAKELGAGSNQPLPEALRRVRDGNTDPGVLPAPRPASTESAPSKKS